MCFFFLIIRRPPRSTQSRSSAASDVYKRQKYNDGQLEELLISNYGLSKIEAADQIKKLSIEIIEEIKESGSYSIPGIGILINDSKLSLIHISEPTRPY